VLCRAFSCSCPSPSYALPAYLSPGLPVMPGGVSTQPSAAFLSRDDAAASCALCSSFPGILASSFPPVVFSVPSPCACLAFRLSRECVTSYPSVLTSLLCHVSIHTGPDAARGTRRTGRDARTRPHEGTRENANASSSVTVSHGAQATLRAHASRSPAARPPRRRARRARASARAACSGLA
jgi:hypothetical protein